MQTEDDLRRLLAVARDPVSWDFVSAEERWFRPRTGYEAARSAFVRSARAFLDGTGEATTEF
ncbi:hypothetical protein DWB77_00230 [Streptomyces hundungensis]|uniref:Uncharacterized protein n=1 Tax=Streptomyces hundungensis TaxID=1077946 RepID=A0A387H7J7_9ACTN|nr:hypothetical protein [Streptomyces hundungensis]AYG78123.1 hypothetical protein DWB77_00230 [Streptomyces hundungensis]